MSEKLTHEELVLQMKKEQREKEEAAPFVEMVKNLADNCNRMGVDNATTAKHMAREFSRQHRTLQQSSIKLLKLFIDEIGKTDMRFTDARNEHAITLCKRLSEVDEYLPFI